MTAALRFWLSHGVDGFRLDAIDRLLKDPQLRDDPPASEPFALPLAAEYAELRHVHSLNAPDIGDALRALREAVGDALLIGEVYLPTAELAPYLEVLDVAFAFEAMNAGPNGRRMRSALAAAIETGKVGWVLSNHDFERLASRFGESARAAAMLFLCLPGPVFIFQGDELGQPNGPGVTPPLDRADRDRFRHPMQWDASPTGGFTVGRPWLEPIDPVARNVADQAGDPTSTLELFRSAIALRGSLDGEVALRESPAEAVVLQRGDHVVAVNFGEQPVDITRDGEVVLEARPGDGADASRLPSHGGWVTRIPSH
jgi:alpha-glucosidase